MMIAAAVPAVLVAIPKTTKSAAYETLNDKTEIISQRQEQLSFLRVPKTTNSKLTLNGKTEEENKTKIY